MKNKKSAKHAKKFRIRKLIKGSTIYFILFMALSGMIDYYALMEFNLMWFLPVSLAAALILGYYHTKSGKHSHVDDVANELL